MTGGMELGWVAGDRGDTAGAVSGGDWDAAPKEQERCQGQAPPGIQSRMQGSDEMVKDTCLCPVRRVSKLCFPEGF